MLKDFGDVGMSDSEAGGNSGAASSAASASDESLESLDSELGDSKAKQDDEIKPKLDDGDDEEEHHSLPLIEKSSDSSGNDPATGDSTDLGTDDSLDSTLKPKDDSPKDDEEA